MRTHTPFAAAFLIGLCGAVTVSPAAAQERIRLSVNAAQQSTTTDLTQEQTFQQYFEEGSFTFDRTTDQDVVFDGSGMVRVSARAIPGAFFASGGGVAEAPTRRSNTHSATGPPVARGPSTS